MQKLSRLLLLFSGVILLGCASDDEDVIVVSPLPEFTTSLQVNKLWTHSVDGVGDMYNAITPVVAYEKVFLPSADGKIIAVNKAGGELVWEVDLEAKISGAVSAGNDVIVIGTLDAEVIVLDQVSGKEKWRTLVSSEVISPPAIGENTIVVNAIDGKLFCLDVSTGRRQWFYDRNVPVLTLRGTSSSQISRGAAVSGFANGKVAAFVLENGGLIWEKRVASPSGRSELDRMIDIDANPVIYGEYVYAASYNGNIVALRLRDGEVVWQRELSTHQNLGVSSTTLYAADYLSHIKAMDRQSGGTVWNQSKLENRRVTGPAIYKNTVVVGDFEGYLHFMDSSSGDFVARVHQDDDGFMVPPVVDGDVLYALSRDGTLVAYAIK